MANFCFHSRAVHLFWVLFNNLNPVLYLVFLCCNCAIVVGQQSRVGLQLFWVLFNNPVLYLVWSFDVDTFNYFSPLIFLSSTKQLK